MELGNYSRALLMIIKMSCWSEMPEQNHNRDLEPSFHSFPFFVLFCSTLIAKLSSWRSNERFYDLFTQHLLAFFRLQIYFMIFPLFFFSSLSRYHIVQQSALLWVKGELWKRFFSSSLPVIPTILVHSIRFWRAYLIAK